MHKNSNLLLCSIIAPMILSCTSDDVQEMNRICDNEYQDIIRQISVHVQDYEFDNELSSRSLTYTGSGVPFAWGANDSIGVYPSKGDQIGFSMADGVGTNDAKIDGGAWGLKANFTYGAYYPFSKKNFFNDRNNIILDYTGQVEDGIAQAEHLARYDYLASNDVTASNGLLNFNMERLGCILILRLTVPQAGKYTSVTLSADNEVFVSQAKLVLGNPKYLQPIKRSKTHEMWLTNVTTTQSNQVIDLLTALAPVDLTGVTFTVTLKGANGYLYKGTKTPTSAYSAGKVTRTSITLKLDSSSNVGFGGEFNINETGL